MTIYFHLDLPLTILSTFKPVFLVLCNYSNYYPCIKPIVPI